MAKELISMMQYKAIQINEIAWDTYKDIPSMFNNDYEFINKLRKRYENNCVGAADVMKKILNNSGILAEVIVFKRDANCSAYPLEIFGKKYTHHAVTLIGDGIIDILHSNYIFKTKDYIKMLEEDNGEIIVYKPLSTGWFTKTGYQYIPTLKELKEYEY